MRPNILILAYNAADTILDCINSAQSQTIDCNIIVVNDGSTDQTLDIIQTIDNITIIDQNNMGIINSLNNILESIDGPICRLDADDALPNNAIESLMSKYDESTIVYGSYVEIYQDKCKIVYPSDIYQCLACGVLLNAEAIKQVGGFATNDVGIFVEYDLYARLIQANISVIGINDIVYYYNRKYSVSTRNINNVNKSIKLLDNKWNIANRIRSYEF